MSNSFKSIKELFANSAKISELLYQHQDYYAHIPKQKGSAQAAETLEEHTELVQKKVVQAVTIYQLDRVIDSLIADFIQANFPEQDQLRLGNGFKDLFAKVIIFHDYGKVNENFQADSSKMNNPKFTLNPNSPIQTFHSGLSAYLFISSQLTTWLSLLEALDTNAKSEKANLWAYLILAFAFPIFKHHGAFLQSRTALDFFTPAALEKMITYLDCYQLKVYHLFRKDLITFIQHVFENVQQGIIIKKAFNLHLLLRLNFSLLTACDYQASGEYMLQLPLNNFHLLTHTRKEEMYQQLTQADHFAYSKKYNYNQACYQAFPVETILRPTQKGNQHLNQLRQSMCFEVIQNIRANSDQHLFYIEAPTGGGKTNLSMIAAMELLVANTSLNQLYYVFPFTTLIHQTYDNLLDTLGLSPNEVIALHSKAGFKYQNAKEGVEDGIYGQEKYNFIDNVFVNYPVCLISHVAFFDLLKSNNKQTTYLLHRLANSVVVIDELQSYNPDCWDKVLFFIEQFAQYFNIKFVIMSATLPKLERLRTKKEQVSFVPLIPNAKTQYFQNPNFAQRVQFNFDLLQLKDFSLDHLAEAVLKQAKTYSLQDYGAAKPVGSVYVIVEFIFKKTATAFYQLIESLPTWFDNVWVLSGTILEHRRRTIINQLKNPEQRKKRTLLITTQVVEAGVDIDMDLGFKDRSIVDSDEQLAGRINRNVNKQQCTLFLFRYDRSSILYANDLRYKLTKQRLSLEEYRHILRQKDFDLLYDLVLEDIQCWNTSNGALNFDNYYKNFEQLDFKAVHLDFQLIDQENLSIFVPLQLPLKIQATTGSLIDLFNQYELELLQEAGILTNNATHIDGAILFSAYEQAIEQPQPDYIKNTIHFQTFQGILSKFVFSIFKSPKLEQQLLSFTNPTKSNLGYLYLSHWEAIYDIHSGLKEQHLDDSEHQIF